MEASRSESEFISSAFGKGGDLRSTWRLTQFICLAGEEEGRDKKQEDVHGWWPRSRSSGVGDGGGGEVDIFIQRRYPQFGSSIG